MSYTFVPSSSDKAGSLRSPCSSRSSSISSGSSSCSSSSIYSPTLLAPKAPLPTKPDPKVGKSVKFSLFHHKQEPAHKNGLIDVKREQREARAAQLRAERLRESLLREPMVDDEESTPAERRKAADSWKSHYESMIV